MSRDGIISALVFLSFVGLVLITQGGGADGAWRGVGILLLSAVLFLTVYYWIAGPIVSFVLWRALLAMVPVGAVAVGLIYLVLGSDGLGLGAEAIDEAVRAGLIAAIVVAAGWVVGFVTQELRRNDERDELRSDLIEALLVELAFLKKRSSNVVWEDEKERAQQAFFKDSRYVPYVHLEFPSHALDKILDNIELLHKEQIATVSAYAHLINEIRQLTGRMSQQDFAQLDAARREKVFLFWLDLQSRVADAATAAINDLERPTQRGLIRRPK